MAVAFLRRRMLIFQSGGGPRPRARVNDTLHAGEGFQGSIIPYERAQTRTNEIK